MFDELYYGNLLVNNHITHTKKKIYLQINSTLLKNNKVRPFLGFLLLFSLFVLFLYEADSCPFKVHKEFFLVGGGDIDGDCFESID